MLSRLHELADDNYVMNLARYFSFSIEKYIRLLDIQLTSHY